MGIPDDVVGFETRSGWHYERKRQDEWRGECGAWGHYTNSASLADSFATATNIQRKPQQDRGRLVGFVDSEGWAWRRATSSGAQWDGKKDGLLAWKWVPMEEEAAKPGSHSHRYEHYKQVEASVADCSAAHARACQRAGAMAVADLWGRIKGRLGSDAACLLDGRGRAAYIAALDALQPEGRGFTISTGKGANFDASQSDYVYASPTKALTVGVDLAASGAVDTTVYYYTPTMGASQATPPATEEPKLPAAEKAQPPLPQPPKKPDQWDGYEVIVQDFKPAPTRTTSGGPFTIVAPEDCRMGGRFGG